MDSELLFKFIGYFPDFRPLRVRFYAFFGQPQLSKQLYTRFKILTQLWKEKKVRNDEHYIFFLIQFSGHIPADTWSIKGKLTLKTRL